VIKQFSYTCLTFAVKFAKFSDNIAKNCFPFLVPKLSETF